MIWLKQHGFTEADVVTMDYDEYMYKEGTVGLYTLNENLFSVILFYPQTVQRDREKEFSLQNTPRITIPYNVFLSSRGFGKTLTL